MHVLPSYVVDGYVREKRAMVGSSLTSSPVATFTNYVRRFWAHHRRSSTATSRSSRAPSIPPQTFIPSPSTSRFILLCMLWYSTSALSSNTGKAILIQFRYPITLTFVQFGFVSLYCAILMSPPIRFSRMRTLSLAIVKDTLPMGVFQVGGHIFASVAISRIPVSTVHTIKALSPLFTVAAYALLFRVSYSTKTYISLFPLTIGVMSACTFDMNASNALGLFCAFGSTIVFVSQNIFFKKIMPYSETEPRSTHASHKLDKINMLFYSSLMALVLMVPIWMYWDLPVFLSASPSHLHPTKGHTTAAHPHSVPTNFFLNGTVHFAQSILAFVLLSSTSPVTYSIASLVKRVTVICIAIMWFKQRVHFVQAMGIVLTFFGLWMYNSAKNDGSVERGERKRGRVEKAVDGRLPTSIMDDARVDLRVTQPAIIPGATSTTSAYSRPKTSTLGVGGPPPRSLSLHTHYPPHNLHITITPSMASKLAPHNSPKDSYPSPPPSLDSPIENVPPVHLGTPTATVLS